MNQFDMLYCHCYTPNKWPAPCAEHKYQSHNRRTDQYRLSQEHTTPHHHQLITGTPHISQNHGFESAISVTNVTGTTGVTGSTNEQTEHRNDVPEHIDYQRVVYRHRTNHTECDQHWRTCHSGRCDNRSLQSKRRCRPHRLLPPIHDTQREMT